MVWSAAGIDTALGPLGFLLALARFLPIALLVPVFGPQRSTPLRVMAGVALALVVTPALTAGLSRDVLASAAPGAGHIDGYAVLAAIVAEAALGAALGFVAALPFQTARAAGGLLATGFSDRPAELGRTLGRFTVLATIVAFTAIDGHLWLLRAVAASYRAIPVAGIDALVDGLDVAMHSVEPSVEPSGDPFIEPFRDQSGDQVTGMTHIVTATGRVIAAALAIAAPLLVARLLASLALAAISRVRDGLNQSLVDSPVRVLVALAVLLLAAGVIADLLAVEAGRVFRAITDLIHAMSGGREP